MANTFKSLTSPAVGTANTKVGAYTVSANTQTTVIGMTLANVANTQVNVSAFINNGSSNTHLIKNAPVPAGSALIVVGGDQKIVLPAGYSMYVYSDAAGSVDVIMSVLEMA